MATEQSKHASTWNAASSLDLLSLTPDCGLHRPRRHQPPKGQCILSKGILPTFVSSTQLSPCLLHLVFKIAGMYQEASPEYIHNTSPLNKVLTYNIT